MGGVLGFPVTDLDKEPGTLIFATGRHIDVDVDDLLLAIAMGCEDVLDHFV
jgi:hypothetical protein